MSAKNILLAMPTNHNLHLIFEENLKYHGFHVCNISHFFHTEFRYPNLPTRLATKFRQLFLQEKKAKQNLQFRLAKETILNEIKKIEQFDFALFIRPDIYPLALIEQLKPHVAKWVAYQWDGIGRYPEVNDYIEQFDRFFLFDPHDFRQPEHRFLPTTNFYFDHLPPLPHNPQNDCYFVGAHLDERVAEISQFAQFAQAHGLKLDFNVGCAVRHEKTLRPLYPHNVTVSGQTYGFADNLARLQNSRILVDFKTPVHHGLSFRSFEALGYRKKLITTNHEIAHYDFYHPNNVCIWDGQDFDKISAFLALPYHELPPHIYEKYRFGNWIRHILNLTPHIPISLPNI
ncbi:hypothetical protein [Alysiella filiformis]|uniref:Uncharacterized protein n=1 Tax=Alysiella filiformis DSM 16848 TaxID=1120981 RepID=A0A286EBM5_9NEIS|nr:hypothetical protein [Alysiella filiformis]QMT31289.1 hypothetical protein H3L97_11480 [Alysiella filiformis]UBQ55705.1 hypothetical protein JF568_08985 [Alysiella filiformis DSM 16848]SOD68288.1 hypothetical protein SAMN02746062_01188 [Alysiella filiformis DSM 16848]